MRELELLQRGATATSLLTEQSAPLVLDGEEMQDLEEAPDNEVEVAEEEILDRATAARTFSELKAEIETPKRLKASALFVRRNGEGKKWRELARPFGKILTLAVLHKLVVWKAAAKDENLPRSGKNDFVEPVNDRNECYYRHNVCLNDCA